jgi:hypothetical protein
LIDFSYLPKQFLRENVLTKQTVVSWLDNNRTHQIDRILEIVNSDHDPVDVLICRSRALQAGGIVRLLIYSIPDYEWLQVRLPDDDEGSKMHVDDNGQYAKCCHCGDDTGNNRMLTGLQSMIVHNGFLYVLCSIADDVRSYVGESTESKRFMRVDLTTGRWQTLMPPSVVRFQCRLAASVDGIYAVDRAGRVELYLVDDSRWIIRCTAGFPPSPTLYVLPMPANDGRIFAMRTYSSGYSFHWASRSLALHCLCKDSLNWQMLPQSDIEYHDMLPPTAGDVDFHGYTVGPGAITLHDELDRARVKFDLTLNDWHQAGLTDAGNVHQHNQRNIGQSRPNFVGEILGSVAYIGRVFCVAEPRKSPKHSRLIMFDQLQQRFSVLCPPPADLSGLLCRATMGRSALAMCCSID